MVVLAPNAWDEDKRLLIRYAKKEKLKQRILLNAGALFDSYGGVMIPTVLFVDRHGVVRDVEVGFGDPDHLVRLTEKLLAAN